jgi:hypothetical protein
MAASIYNEFGSSPALLEIINRRKPEPAGNHIATKIISMCSEGLNDERRATYGRFIEWACSDLAGGDLPSLDDQAGVKRLIDYIFNVKHGVEKCADEWANWDKKPKVTFGYEPPPAPGSKPKNKGGRPRSKRAVKSAAALAEEAGVIIHPEDLATLEEPGEAVFSASPEPEDEVPLDDLVAEMRATLKPYRTFTGQNAGAPRPPKLGVCIVVWDERANKWFLYGASTDDALIRTTLKSL